MKIWVHQSNTKYTKHTKYANQNTKYFLSAPLAFVRYSCIDCMLSWVGLVAGFAAAQDCINRSILPAGLGARGVSSEHMEHMENMENAEKMENMEMFSGSPT